MNKEQEYLPITIEQLRFLIKKAENKNQNSFLFLLGDSIKGKSIVPELLISFPHEIAHKKKYLEKKLEKFKENENENTKSKDMELKKPPSLQKPKNSPTHNSKQKDSSTYLESKKKKSSSDNDSSSSEEINKIKSIKKPKLESDELSNTNKKQEKIFREDSVPNKSNGENNNFLNQSLLKESDNEWILDETQSNITMNEGLQINYNNTQIDSGLIKKFKLKEEKRFYITHWANKVIRNSLSLYIKEESKLDYQITEKAFILIAKNDSNKKKFLDVFELLKKKIKKELNFLKHDLKANDFHAFKKICHNLENKNRFEGLRFLKLKNYDEKNVESIIYYWDEKYKTNAEKFIRMIKERHARQIPMLKIKYMGYKMGRKFKDRKDFKIIIEEGKLVSKYFEIKEKIIKNELVDKKLSFLKNLNCELLVFRSSKEDREYNSSLIFHWSLLEERKKSKEEFEKLEIYFHSLKREFYDQFKFCAFIFERLDNVPEIMENDEGNDYLWISHQKNLKSKDFNLFIFGDSKEIGDYLEKIKKKFKIAFKSCEKFKFLIKINNYDNLHEFNNFKKEFPDIIKKISSYEEDEKTCQYSIVNFKRMKKVSKILETMQIIVRTIFSKQRKDRDLLNPRSSSTKIREIKQKENDKKEVKNQKEKKENTSEEEKNLKLSEEDDEDGDKYCEKQFKL